MYINYKIMTELYWMKTFCDIVTYECPHCGEINTFCKPMFNLFLENNIDYIVCDGCDTKIKI